MPDIDSLDERLRDVESAKVVWEKTDGLRREVDELKSVVTSARYFLTFAAGVVSLVGVGLTAFTAILSYELSNAQTALGAAKQANLDTQKSLKETEDKLEGLKEDARRTNTETQNLLQQAQQAKDSYKSLIDSAQSVLSENAKVEASKAVNDASLKLIPLFDGVQQKFNTLEFDFPQTDGMPTSRLYSTAVPPPCQPGWNNASGNGTAIQGGRYIRNTTEPGGDRNYGYLYRVCYRFKG